MKIVLIAVVVLVLAVVVAFVVMGIQSRGGAAPGISGDQLKPCPTNPNCVSSTAPQDSKQYVAAFSFAAGEADLAWADLVATLVDAGGELNQNSAPYLAATFTSQLFGFVDDFECLIDRDAGLIQVRSGARVGYSDMNVNRERVERIRAMLDERRR
jgi:uncharacterized protein (DUF1499 family)